MALVIALPFNQLRTLYYVSFLAVMSFVTIMACVVISFCFLLSPVSSESVCLKEPLPEQDVMSMFGACSGFIYAYSSQFMFPEIQSEMKRPRDFPKALHVTLFIMLIVYSAVSMVAYRKCGEFTPAYVLKVIPQGPWQRVVGILMLLHMLVSYTIMQQVFTRGMFCMTGLRAGLENTVRGRVLWFFCNNGARILCYGPCKRHSQV